MGRVPNYNYRTHNSSPVSSLVSSRESIGEEDVVIVLSQPGERNQAPGRERSAPSGGSGVYIAEDLHTDRSGVRDARPSWRIRER